MPFFQHNGKSSLFFCIKAWDQALTIILFPQSTAANVNLYIQKIIYLFIYIYVLYIYVLYIYNQLYINDLGHQCCLYNTYINPYVSHLMAIPLGKSHLRLLSHRQGAFPQGLQAKGTGMNG